MAASSRIMEDGLDPRTSKHWEGAFTQGSGYLHLRGSHEEGLAAAPQDEAYVRLPANVTLEKPRHPRSKWGTYVPGITGQHPLLRQELVNLPFFLDLRVLADGEPLDMDAPGIDGYERSLDLRDAVLRRSFRWSTRSGSVLQACYERYVSARRPGVCVQRVEYACTQGRTELRLESGIDARVRTNGHDHFTRVHCGARGPRAGVVVTTDTGDVVAMCTEARGAGAGGAAFSAAEGLERRPSCAASFRLQAGPAAETLRLWKLSAVATSRDPGARAGDDPMARAERDLDAALRDDSHLYAEHAEMWEAMWRDCELVIEGDPEAQRAVRFAQYHLLRAANPHDPRVAVCAKGAAGEAYFGHFFWDTEIYLLPFYLYSRPETARALVEFRLNTLDGARRNAALYGYPGARYPWESSVTGDEQCPNWQYADFEVHVTADVAHAIRHYVAATGDRGLLERAVETLVETSRYWVGRVERRPDGSVNLNGVMGPDEYTCFSNNNAYTNDMVRRALRFTVQTLDDLGAHGGTAARELIRKLAVTDQERAAWGHIAQSLPVRVRPPGVIEQCDHFDDLERLDFSSVWKDRGRPLGHFISQERNYRSQALKQADSLMLPYLFPAEFPESQARATWDRYEPVTTHDSSLSCVVHSILAARLGRGDDSYRLFRRSLGIDLDPEGGGAAEGIHIANCGGIWQAVVLGLAGMGWAYESDLPRFTPRLPTHWKAVSFPLRWRGRRYAVRITPAGTELKETGSSETGPSQAGPSEVR